MKAFVVMPGDALLRYTVPMPDDSLVPGRVTEKVTLPGFLLSSTDDGGPGWIRTINPTIMSRLLCP